MNYGLKMTNITGMEELFTRLMGRNFYYLLHATPEIRNEFDPDSGLENDGKGHYPQCLVSTAYDVFRRMPIGRVVNPCDSSERERLYSN